MFDQWQMEGAIAATWEHADAVFEQHPKTAELRAANALGWREAARLRGVLGALTRERDEARAEAEEFRKRCPSSQRRATMKDGRKGSPPGWPEGWPTDPGAYIVTLERNGQTFEAFALLDTDGEPFLKVDMASEGHQCSQNLWPGIPWAEVRSWVPVGSVQQCLAKLRVEVEDLTTRVEALRKRDSEHIVERAKLHTRIQQHDCAMQCEQDASSAVIGALRAEVRRLRHPEPRTGVPDEPCWAVVRGTMRGEPYRGIAVWNGRHMWPYREPSPGRGLSEIHHGYPMDPGFGWWPLPEFPKEGDDGE